MQQEFAAGFDGGTGGDDIVNKQHVEARQFGCVAQRKDSLHVVHAGLPFLAGLGAGVGGAVEVSRADGAMEDFGDAQAEHFALVVAPLPPPPPMQGHGHEEVDLLEPARLQEVHAHLPSEAVGQLRGIAVFDLVEEGLGGGAVFEQEQGGGRDDR